MKATHTHLAWKQAWLSVGMFLTQTQNTHILHTHTHTLNDNVVVTSRSLSCLIKGTHAEWPIIALTQAKVSIWFIIGALVEPRAFFFDKYFAWLLSSVHKRPI